MVRSNSAIWGHFLPNCTITETISPIVYNLDKNVEERERAFRHYCSSSALKLQPKLYSPTFRHFLSSLGTDNSPRIKVKALAFQKKFQKSFHFGMQIKLGNNSVSVSRSYAKFSWQLHFVTFFFAYLATWKLSENEKGARYQIMRSSTLPQLHCFPSSFKSPWRC